MTTIASSPPLHLGFLTILTEESGTLGGYLVTNLWGRPLEFRLSNPVRPNKVQQILYGPTLTTYVSAELIGKTLVSKTSTPARLILTDQRSALELRRQLDVPVIWTAPTDDAEAASMVNDGLAVRETVKGQGAILVHPDFKVDVPICAEIMQRIGAGLDFSEPFVRVCDAIREARKMGVSHRAAG